MYIVCSVLMKGLVKGPRVDLTRLSSATETPTTMLRLGFMSERLKRGYREERITILLLAL